MEVQVAVGKIGKWASSESGDTLEMVERPHGGFSFVLVDGQLSGRSAKSISSLVARKAISELSEGVRDGAAARAAHDYLFTHRGGKVSATLNILSVDLVSNSIVVSRNNRCPVIVVDPNHELQLISGPSFPVGVRRTTKPQITELPLVVGTLIVAYTDGLETAGARSGCVFDVCDTVAALARAPATSAQVVVDSLLKRAIELDDGRPHNDISAMAIHVIEREGDGVRRLSVRIPF